jgi:hypothetical protein|tara:strand:- start:191 stop:547 length:357 start_codon:yes stop_codon:yes gene_type:complete
MEHAPKKVGVHEAATLYGWLVLHTTPTGHYWLKLRLRFCRSPPKVSKNSVQLFHAAVSNRNLSSASALPAATMPNHDRRAELFGKLLFETSRIRVYALYRFSWSSKHSPYQCFGLSNG